MTKLDTCPICETQQHRPVGDEWVCAACEATIIGVRRDVVPKEAIIIPFKWKDKKGKTNE